MQSELGLRQIIYDLLKTQIDFGAYRFGDSLPTIKEASRYFMASIDTVRLAYLQLKKENYISLSTCIGATVIVCYSDEDIQQHIQEFFVRRKNTMLDLASSMQSLLCYAQWFSLKNTPVETLDEMEQICSRKEISPPYWISQHLMLLYRPLGNDLFLRLIWQIFLFFKAPFLSIPENIKYFQLGDNPILEMVQLCRKKDWNTLWDTVNLYQKQLFSALCEFYNTSIPLKSNAKQIDFTWNIYKKPSQLCYSFCQELLFSVHCGIYPPGAFLPPPSKLAKEKQVSVNTVRRTIVLLNKLGVMRSINGVGTKVLPPLSSAMNSDFSDKTIQKRLLDFAQSFQFVALSCRATARITIASMNDSSIHDWIELLEKVKLSNIYENLIYVCYEFISLYAPYQTIRTVYTELLRQLFWGLPLRDLHGDRESINAHFLPYLESLKECLYNVNPEGFAEKFEQLQITETEQIIKSLLRRGIQEAESILIPRLTS